jgi:hypothetical protein
VSRYLVSIFSVLLSLNAVYSEISNIRMVDSLYSFHPAIHYDFTSSNLPIVVIDLNEKIAPRAENRRVQATLQILYRVDGSTNYLADTLSVYQSNPNIVNYAGRIGIKFRGSSSFNADKKPFSFKTQNAAGENTPVDILGMGADSDWALLAPFYDKSLVRETLVFELMRGYIEFSPPVKYCELVLNGIYQGIYILIGRPRKGESRLNLPKPKTNSVDALSGGYLLEFDRHEGKAYFTSEQHQQDIYGNQLNGRRAIIHKYPNKDDYETGKMDDQRAYIENHIHFIEDILNGDNYTDSLNGYRKYWDVTSVIDYILAQETTRNVDAYRLSTHFYKRRNSVDPRIKMTIWDFDRGWGNSRTSDAWSPEGWAWNSTTNSHPFWFKRFLSDESFREELWSRWRDYRTTKFTDENVMNTIDSLIYTLGEAQERNFIVWDRWGKEAGPAYYVGTSWQEETDYLKQWILDRFKWLDSQFKSYPKNYVANASFDADRKRGVGSFNTVYLSNWTISDSKEVTLSSNKPHNGTYNLVLKNQSEAFQVLTELPTDSYTLKAWVRTVRDPKAVVVLNHHGNTPIEFEISNSANYYEITVPDIEVSSGLCKIAFQTHASIGNNAQLHVDDISFFRTRSDVGNSMYNPALNFSVRTYPNPFVDKLIFDFVQEGDLATIFIYSIDGSLIDQIYSSGQPGTRQAVSWNPTEQLNPGIYFYSIQSGNKLQQGKIVKQ